MVVSKAIKVANAEEDQHEYAVSEVVDSSGDFSVPRMVDQGVEDMVTEPAIFPTKGSLIDLILSRRM